ncbi:MAG: 3-dehydroquinate synthase family protein, partial [Fusobacteriaceae bacterium]
AVESIYDFKNITHGEGVAKGIIFELEISKNYYAENQAQENIDKLQKQVIEIFESYEIDWTPIYFSEEVLIEAMSKDKKNSTSGINFICLKNYGELENLKIKESIIKDINKKLCESESLHTNKIEAVMDLGSNSTRLLVAEISCHKNNSSKKIIRSICKITEITGLAKGLGEEKKLKDDAINRTLVAIKKLLELAKSYGVSGHVKAIATSAVRDAQNREYFLEQVKKIGVEVECISGDLEAKLSFIGVGSSFESENKIGIIDIGGGSTEFSYGIGHEILYAKSFDVGAVRSKEKFFLDSKYNEQNILECKNWIAKEFAELKKIYEKDKEFKLIGVAGTVTTHVSVAEKMKKYDTKKVHKYNLSKKNIEKNLQEFLGLDLEERKKIVGLQPERAEYVIAGSLILLGLLDVLGKDAIIVSEIDNLEGVLIY